MSLVRIAPGGRRHSYPEVGRNSSAILQISFGKHVQRQNFSATEMQRRGGHVRARTDPARCGTVALNCGPDDSTHSRGGSATNIRQATPIVPRPGSPGRTKCEVRRERLIAQSSQLTAHSSPLKIRNAVHASHVNRVSSGRMSPRGAVARGRRSALRRLARFRDLMARTSSAGLRSLGGCLAQLATTSPSNSAALGCLATAVEAVLCGRCPGPRPATGR